MASTFRSLQNRNARLFFFGLLLSNIGTWVQFTAVAILVDRLTGRTTALGVLTALQFLPMLFLGAYAGAIADQRDRRRMAMLTQGGLAVQAVALAIFDLTGTINLGVIYVLTFLLGIVSAFDNPARRGFVTELVPQEDIADAISLNTATMTGSRIFGPAIAALLVGPIGTGWLFSINAFSFLAILGSLFLLDKATLFPAPRANRGGTPVRDGLRYIRRAPNLFAPFIVFTLVATFGFNHNVVFPRMAREIWGSETWFGWVLTTMSIGSLLGSLLTASRPVVTLRWMIANGVVLGLAGLALAFSGRVWLALPLGGATRPRWRRLHHFDERHHPTGVPARHARSDPGADRSGVPGLVPDRRPDHRSGRRLRRSRMVTGVRRHDLVGRRVGVGVVGTGNPPGGKSFRGHPNPARLIEPDGPQPQRTPLSRLASGLDRILGARCPVLDRAWAELCPLVAGQVSPRRFAGDVGPGVRVEIPECDTIIAGHTQK